MKSLVSREVRTDVRSRLAAALTALGLLAVPGAVSACGGGSASLAAASTTHISGLDRSWINQAHQANLAEVEAGQLAMAKSGSAAVRSAGATLARDHTAADAKLVSAAQKLKVKLPDYLTRQEADASHRLGSETGAQFDHDFLAAMMTGHQQLIALTTKEISHGTSPSVVAMAKQTLPTLQKHLRMLQAAVPTA